MAAEDPNYKRLRSWRKRRGLTQKQLAELAGTNQTRLSRIENGSEEPTLHLAFAFERLTKRHVRANAWPAVQAA